MKMREPAAPSLPDLGGHGRIAGPAHPLAAGRFQRAMGSGDAPQAQEGQVAVAIGTGGDEHGTDARRGVPVGAGDYYLAQRPPWRTRGAVGARWEHAGVVMPCCAVMHLGWQRHRLVEVCRRFTSA